MQIRKVHWSEVATILEREAGDLHDIFSAAVASSVEPELYIAELGYGEDLMVHGNLVNVPREHLADEAAALFWAKACSPAGPFPICVPLSKTFEVRALTQQGAKPSGTQRYFPTTLIYPGEPFGLWEAVADLRGDWTITAGCRSFLFLESFGQEKILDNIGVLTPGDDLKFTKESSLNFFSLYDAYRERRTSSAPSQWTAQVLLFSPDMFTQQNPYFDLKLADFLKSQTISQLSRALRSNRDARLKFHPSLHDLTGMAAELARTLLSLYEGDMFGYYVSCLGDGDDGVIEDLPLSEVMAPFVEYKTALGRRSKDKMPEEEISKLPIFVPCRWNERTRARTRSRIYQFPNICPVFETRDFHRDLETTLSDVFILRNSSNKLRNYLTPLGGDKRTSGRFRNGADSEAFCVHFYHMPGNKRAAKNLNTIDFRGIHSHYQSPISNIRFGLIPPQVLWAIQLDMQY